MLQIISQNELLVERSFAALKGIETFPRNRMSSERFSELALSSIERKINVK